MLFHYLFFIGSIGGFFLELFYRRIVFKKWMKPGVFNGFYLPLYGMGLVVCYGCYSLSINIIFKAIIAMCSLTFIELLCGIIFIKKLKIQLWDYSKNFLNYKGLICVKFSVYWVILALLSFMIFRSVRILTNNLMNVIVILFEIILIIDVIMFVAKKSYKNKKRNFHLDL